MNKRNFEVALVKELCPICLKEMDGPIIMNQMLNEKAAKEVKECQGKVIGISETPCDECKKDLEKAFIFIGFDESKSDMKHLPEGFYRTGHIVGVKKDIPLVQEFVKEKSPKGYEAGYLFIPRIVMEELGLIKKI